MNTPLTRTDSAGAAPPKQIFASRQFRRDTHKIKDTPKIRDTIIIEHTKMNTPLNTDNTDRFSSSAGAPLKQIFASR